MTDNVLVTMSTLRSRFGIAAGRDARADAVLLRQST